MALSLENITFPCIAAHRGSCGGNIVANTIPAFEAAVRQGAMIVETDVAKTADGKFYLFHTGKESIHFGQTFNFEEKTSDELTQIPLLNEFGSATRYRIDSFDDVLEALKDRCLINLDRCWQNWEEIIPIIERHGMRDQIILKSPCKKEWIDKVKEVAPDYAYMPIINEDITPFYEMGGREIPGFVGAELVFSSEDSPIIVNDIPGTLRKSGKHAWGNGIVFSDAKVLSAGHSDDISIIRSPEAGWGWLIDRGFDIIQTDWVALLSEYIRGRNH